MRPRHCVVLTVVLALSAVMAAQSSPTQPNNAVQPPAQQNSGTPAMEKPVSAAAPAADVPANTPQWTKDEVKDPFRGNSYLQYTLTGKYLKGMPGSTDTPFIVLQCVPEKHGHGSAKYDGKLLDAYLWVGHTVVNSHIGFGHESKVTVEYRMDDGKIHTNYLFHSESWEAVSLQPAFCGECMVDDLFYGHELPHKAGSGPQMKKLLFNIPQFQGSNIVIQFDLPDVTEVATVCGVISHK